MSNTRLAFLFIVLISLGLVLALSIPARAQPSPLTPVEQLGKALFFDKALSAGGVQSCASCHDPAVGYTGPDSAINAHGAVYPGAIAGRFGNRKPPAAAYAGDSPKLAYNAAAGTWVGGMFWDGRATGNELGDPLAEQAKGPFLNPLEMALSSPAELCSKVAASSYTSLYEQVWGAGSLDCTSRAAQVYDEIGKSIAAYERSSEVNPYSSKFDAFWNRAKAKRLDVTRITAGNWTKYRNLGLNDTQLYGLALFNDPAKANCASCHSLQPGSRGYPLFTDYAYDNIGVPKNPENPFYSMPAEYNPDGAAWVDYGLGGYLETVGEPAQAEIGKHKVPTLRNVDKRPSVGIVKAYGHNGYFKSLAEIVHFYRMRAMGGGGMGGGGMGGGGGCGGMGCGGMSLSPEVPENLASLSAGFCGRDESNIVEFLKTLTDN